MESEENLRLASASEKKEARIAGISFSVAAVILGAFAGVIVWLFLKLSGACLFFLWEVLPARFETAYYPLLLCVAGGIIIGLWRKKFGDYPQGTHEVIETVKTTGRYDSRGIHVLFFAAFLPIIFGGSIGPEAGLVGIIAALFTWVGDRLKYTFKETRELTQIGISTSLGVVFEAPLFGFLGQIEGEGENLSFPRRTKVIVYLCAILGGFGTYFLLDSFFGGGLHFGKFDTINIGRIEIVWFIPLALLGILAAGCHFIIDGALCFILKPWQRFPIALAILAGILLGICGIFFPILLFSGETKMTELNAGWVTMGVSLFLMGFLKLILFNICIQMGWRGGNIVPLVFVGMCFGYGASVIVGTDGVFACAVVLTVIFAAIMRKPITVVLLMLIFFPAKDIIFLIAAAFIGACFPFYRARQ